MLGNGRFLFKRVDSLPKVFSTKPSLRYCNSSTHSEEKIVIPKRIERSPTDILQALASTVNVDPTAFHYKYLDDPYLYPYSIIDKKVYALSKESGKKSAEWIIKENPKFFKDKLAEPPIKVFEALTVSITEEDLTEQGLLNSIQERNVVSAIELYKNLKSRNIDVQKSTKQSLLELVCFFNSEEKQNLDFEEKWFEGFLGRAGGSTKKEIHWNADFAQSLYEEMDPECPLALSAMIQGMLKYRELDTAMELFEKAVNNNMKLPVNVYNTLLEYGVLIIKQRSESSSFIKKLIKEMVNHKVKPNLGTLNGALKILSRTPYGDMSTELIKEFMNFGVKPSLGSYGYLFRCISKMDKLSQENQFYKNLAHAIFNKIENEDHEILHPCDLSFFANTITSFSNCPALWEADLPLRLHDMYMKASNRKFVVKGGEDHGFYIILLPLLFKTQPIDVAMNFYRKHIFTVFNPESKILTEAIFAMRENLAPEYLPAFWQDLGVLRYRENRPILGRIIQLVEDFTDETSLNVIHEAANSYASVLQKRWMEGDEESIQLLLLVFLKKKDENGLEEMMKLIQKKGVMFKDMKESMVVSIFEFGMERKNGQILMGSLNLAADEGMSSLGEMAEKALPLLSGMDKAVVSGLLAEAKKRQKSKKSSTVEKKSPEEEV